MATYLKSLLILFYLAYQCAGKFDAQLAAVSVFWRMSCSERARYNYLICARLSAIQTRCRSAIHHW